MADCLSYWFDALARSIGSTLIYILKIDMRNNSAASVVGLTMFGKTMVGVLFLTMVCLCLSMETKCHADQRLSSSATVDLQMAVNRMNRWLRGSDNEAGWRRYLHLNQLDAECALGEHAQVSTLQRVLERFSGDVEGLDTPEFNDVRIALSQQIALLSASHAFDLNDAVSNALTKYRRVSIADLEMARDTAVYELRLLKQYYRKTMDSRPRAELFYKLELDEQIQYLEELKFELPPEVSAGKTRSMIRDVQEDLDEVQEEIDAMPIDEDDEDGEDDEDQDEDETTTSIDISDNREDDPESVLLSPALLPPGPDDGEETLKDLQQRAGMLKKKIRELKRMYRDLKAEDADRVARRTKVLNRLADFNAGYKKVADDRFDPWFVSTALASENFNFLFFYATDDNLQEEFLKRIGELSELLQESPDLSQRAAHGQAGKLLQWLESAGQAPQLVSLIRREHSQPNLYASVSSSLINGLVAENATSLSRQQRVKEVLFGRIVRGTANIDGNISVVLNPDPHQINLAIQLLGSITSRTYSRERRWCINASAAGNFWGRRQFIASLRGVEASEVESDAHISTSFDGISSNLSLVKRIAAETYQKQKARNEAESTRRTKAQVTDGFVASTDEALKNGQDGIAALGDSMDKFAKFIPPLFVRTLHDRIELVGRKTNQGSLAAPTRPKHYGRHDEIAASVHETMLTNYLDPVFSGKTFTNAELRWEVQSRFGVELSEEGNSDQDTKENPPEDFSITFARVRPIQLEFKDDQLAVIITGRRFAQRGRVIRAGLRFRLTFRIVRQEGALKLVRIGDTQVEYTDPDKKDAKLVAFRSFIEKRLNKTTETEDGVALPDNLIPQSLVEDRPLAKNLVLNTLRLDGGWLYLGWNRSYGYASDLAGIWDQGTTPMPSVLEELESSEISGNVILPVTTEGGDWNSSSRESSVSVMKPAPIADREVILSGAESPIVAGQLIEGEIVQEVFFDGSVSDIPVSVPVQ